MEQVKIKSYELLVEENMELKTVIRKLSHEMGNALTILGASLYYVEGNIKEANLNFDISDLKNDYAYICNLFKGLSIYNQAENNIRKEITVEEIASSIEGSFFKMKGAQDIKFSVIKTKDVSDKKMYGDLMMLRQAFINILKNAIDAVEENEKRNEKKIFVKISCNKKTDYEINDNEFLEWNKGEVSSFLHIEIMDNGKGISDEHMEDIFKPMFTDGKKNGTGLGLPIVRKIIQKHNGKIKAVSVQGTGTAIHIYFPICEK